MEPDDALKRALIDRGVAATSIMANQIENAIKSAKTAHHAYAEMPVPIVCWYLGYLIVELCLRERAFAPYAERSDMASSIASTIRFLRDSAELNARVQPSLAEQALTSVDGFTDELGTRVRYQPLGKEDLTYAGLIPSPLQQMNFVMPRGCDG